MALARTFMQTYKLRLRRKRLLWRAFRKRHELTRVSQKTGSIKDNDILLFATLRNEMLRLPFFLKHYRRLGVAHFLFVDNGSDDGSTDYLARQPDVSLWRSDASYKASRFGMDWLTALQWRYGSGHWTVTVDVDELLIYPASETHQLGALTRWLDSQNIPAMGALMLDLYPKGSVTQHTYQAGQDPTKVAAWFDAYGYWGQRQEKMDNLWLQGGPRARHFFAQTPERAPTLNKIPLVRWRRSYVFVNSTHNALPTHLNRVYDEAGSEKTTGVLLHTKFLPDVAEKARTEKLRAEHFADPAQYADYYDALSSGPDFWSEAAHRYESVQQIEDLRLMFRGNWSPH